MPPGLPCWCGILSFHERSLRDMPFQFHRLKDAPLGGVFIDWKYEMTVGLGKWWMCRRSRKISKQTSKNLFSMRVFSSFSFSCLLC